MKRFTFALAASALLGLSAFAQTKLDLASQAQLRQIRLTQQQTAVPTSRPALKAVNPSAQGKVQTHVLAFARLADGFTEADLRQEGVDVLRSKLGFVLLNLPVDEVERVAALPSLRSVQLGRKVKPLLKYAREATGVDLVHQGTGLSQAYTGKNVVCGIVDMGFDFNHANFLDSEGRNRVKYYENVTLNNYATSDDDLFKITYYNTPEQIAALTTDDKTMYHGTHTMGIMAGGYKGATQAALLAGEDGHSASVQNSIDNPYYGVATEADIVAATCTSFSDLEIVQAVDDLIGYSQFVQKPIVVNLSLGTNQGPHDGTNIVCQYFDALAQYYNAKIVLAAGNEGNLKIAANKTFTADDLEMQSFIDGGPIEIEGKEYTLRYGNVELYSNDETPFEVQAVIYNLNRGRVTNRFSFTLSEETKGTAQYWCSEAYQQTDNDIVDKSFSQNFEGYIGIGWAVNPYSGRAYAAIDVCTLDSLNRDPSKNYAIGFIVKGREGQRIDAFAMGDSLSLDSYGREGWTDGSCNGSVSDMCTGKQTLCVGAYTSTDSWAQLDGFAYSLPEAGLTTGHVAPISSYGTLIDGRNLPHVLAPGAMVVSSMSRYYLDFGGLTDKDDIMSARALTLGRDPFVWGIGTSMACPMVSGIIALWLEANPNLTMAEIKDILAQTSVVDDKLAADDKVQVGAGLIQAYEGLKEVLRRQEAAGIHGVGAEATRLVTTPLGAQRFRVFLAGAPSLQVEVFNMAGVCVARQQAAGDEATLSLAGQPKGSYVVRVNGQHARCLLVQ